jgi:hypothetical protein
MPQTKQQQQGIKGERAIQKRPSRKQERELLKRPSEQRRPSVSVGAVEAAFAMLECDADDDGEEEGGSEAGSHDSPSPQKRTLQRTLSGKGTQMFSDAFANGNASVEPNLEVDLYGIEDT